MRFLLSFAYRMHTSPEQDVFGFSYVPLFRTRYHTLCAGYSFCTKKSLSQENPVTATL